MQPEQFSTRVEAEAGEDHLREEEGGEQDGEDDEAFVEHGAEAAAQTGWIVNHAVRPAYWSEAAVASSVPVSGSGGGARRIADLWFSRTPCRFSSGSCL